MKDSKKLVYLSVLTYTLITGHSFLFGKIALSVADPLNVLAYRFTASFIVVLLLIIFKVVKVNYSLERIKRILPLALFYPLLFFGFQTFGLQYSTSSEAGIINATIPVFTLILATVFLKEATTVLQKLSIAASVTGVIYITLMKGASFDIDNLAGIILVLLSALSFSGYSILARKLTKSFSSIELSMVMITISFIGFNIIALVRNLINGSIYTFLVPLGNVQFVISILYLGILSTLLTSFLTNFVLSKLEASKMSVFSNLATVITIIAGVIFLDEKIYYYHIIGSILIVGGVLGANLLDKKG